MAATLEGQIVFLRDYVYRCAGFMGKPDVKAAFPAGMYSVLLAHGISQEGAPVPINAPKGEPGHCYMNAHHLAMANERLTYVEGQAIHDGLGIPMEHAWCVDDMGQVVDVTWEHPESSVYYGVKFERTFMNVVVLRTGYYGIFGNTWLDDDRLYRKGVVLDEAGRIAGYAE